MRTRKHPIGFLLQHRRVELRMTLEDVAKASGVAIGAISKLEQDPKANPTLKTLETLCDAMNLSLANLFFMYDSLK
jgi:transcriptional regulator with XRE-family HTH domain